MRTAFRSLLLSDASISGMVGIRARPVKLPQAPTYPSISYQIISQTTEPNLDERSRIQTARVQVDAWSKDYDTAITLSGHVRDLLDGYKGTHSGIHFAECWQQNETDLYEDKVGVYRVTSDFQVTFWRVT